MTILNWLRELPIIDDVADTIDIFAEFFPEEDASSIIVGDYAELRDNMFWTVGEDGLDTRERMLTDFALEPVVSDERGKILKGLWRDPLTGFESSDPSDFDIDHRIPFRVIADRFPDLYELPRDEQLAIYNDTGNLQVIHDVHNLEKGAAKPIEHAREFPDATVRDEFLQKCTNYMRQLREQFS